MTESPKNLDRIVTINEKGYDGRQHSRLSRAELLDKGKVMDQFARQMNHINAESLKRLKNKPGPAGISHLVPPAHFAGRAQVTSVPLT